MEAVPAHDLLLSPLFADLSDSDRATLAGWLEAEPVEAGRNLTHQGASGYAFYVLATGTAHVTVDGEVVRTLQAGDYFGEIAMLESGRQTATVTMAEPGTIWIMFGTRFRELQMEYPELAAAIERTARSRLGEPA
jgi:CRP-like cAMP-binding protein